MARRPKLFSGKKPKKIRVTKGEAYYVNRKYYGDEPEAQDLTENLARGVALNWYHAMCDASEAREYIKAYLVEYDRADEASTLSTVPDTWLPLTAAWLCRLHLRGCDLPETCEQFIEDKIVYALTKAKVVESDEPRKVVDIHQRMREKALDLVAELERIVDESPDDFSCYDWLKSREVPASYVPAIINHYSGWVEELEAVLAGEDAELAEAYDYYTEDELEWRAGFLNKLLEDAARYSGNVRKQRAPRKKKAVPVGKQIARLNYQKEDKRYQLASINPEKIIGASELWTFNTRYGTLTVFRALEGGLGVKGTSITNYDESTSVTRRTGRKPEYWVKRVLDSGKPVLKRIMEELTKEASFAHRINDNTILLRVS